MSIEKRECISLFELINCVIGMSMIAFTRIIELNNDKLRNVSINRISNGF